MSGRGRIKCVVWDLDDTLWHGVLLEDERITLREDAIEVIRTLDGRGVLNSIASRNDHEAAMRRLHVGGIDELFLYPQISWGPKSEAITQIAQGLNLGTDALAFVDDQEFERAEVSFRHPEVLCLDVAEVAAAVATRTEFQPRFITDESRQRRQLYRTEAQRQEAEHYFGGTSEEFLATLDLTLTIRPAQEGDLQRAEELTVRTHQLNSTGRTYSYRELDALRTRDDHVVLVASLTDRFGSYGTIGLAVIECAPSTWRLTLLLMSCRVAARGAGTLMLHHVIARARDAGAVLRGDFVDNGRNRMMYLTYKIAGFQEMTRDGDVAVLEWAPGPVPDPPPWATVVTND